ncbi:MAG: DNA topoisomerase I [Gammaproteobacteria bacterium]|nr:DNA topoisomerase I [Gammaproteobacteria bacterium]
MAKNLVIVESPAKGRTIEKYLGKDYEVLASYGHVRDLVPKEGAVDTDNSFAMKYQVIDRNQKHVDAIKRALKKADRLLLATDPDREGEAISWHLAELLREQNNLKDKPIQRVVFHEITKGAVRDALEHPRELSMDLVNAQQARRALDYLVGFNLSPLLWKKIRRGLSAGRVQSPALRLIVEREEEIERFEAREYWSIEAQLEKDEQPFVARLTRLDEEKVEQFTVTDEQRATAVHQQLVEAAQGKLEVLEVARKQRKRNPAPPFTTSTMQQEAVRKLGFSASRTMRVAQQLYEGIDAGDGAVGLITYMRTDSVTLSNDALQDIRELIAQRYGAEKVPEAPRTFKNKTKNAQEAHEAVRPTSAQRHPDDLKNHLSSDQYRLYNLIWQRTVASQMIHATLDTVAVDLACGDARNQFRATGSTVREPGFMAVYREGLDDVAPSDDSRILPDLDKGESVPLHEIALEQHFTEPPPRYSEATLVKTLEEYGIGRPSTYASIISTLQDREYVEMDARRFIPTDVGRVVNRFLSNHFTQYVDYDFTARLEDELDEVSRGEKDWVPLMQNFWNSFKNQVDDKDANVSRAEAVQARGLGSDPKSGRPVTVRIGRYGPYVQIGTKDDEEKPKFAGLRPGQKMDTIALDEALTLFDLPRDLGASPEGVPVSVNIGRFGPYVKYGDTFVSIREDDPYTIDLARALVLVREKQEADAKRLIQDFPEAGVKVLNGRYGPYISDGNKNAKVPKDKEPAKLTLPECQELLAKAPERKKRGKAASKKKTSSKKKASAKSSTKQQD